VGVTGGYMADKHYGILDEERDAREKRLARFRSIIAMRDDQRLTFKQISKQLGIGMQSARLAYYRGLREIEKPIDSDLADLPTRTRNALWRSGIETQSDLFRAVKSGELVKIPEIGGVGILAIHELLGLPLPCDEKPRCSMCGQTIKQAPLRQTDCS